VSANEIAAATGKSRAAIDVLLHRMVADKEVKRVERGRYALAADDSQQIYEFRWADGTVVARFRGDPRKNERFDGRDAGSSIKSFDSDIFQTSADVQDCGRF